MCGTFIATIVAAALAVTAFGAAPARADQDVLKALAAIAGIAIVGKVIHDRNERNQERTAAPRNTTVYNEKRFYDLKPRPLPSRANRRLLPGQCLQSVETRQGRMRYFAKRCLERSYQYVNRLPQACAVRLRGQERHRRGYEARCLRRDGYQLARR